MDGLVMDELGENPFFLETPDMEESENSQTSSGVLTQRGGELPVSLRFFSRHRFGDIRYTFSNRISTNHQKVSI